MHFPLKLGLLIIIKLIVDHYKVDDFYVKYVSAVWRGISLRVLHDPDDLAEDFLWNRVLRKGGIYCPVDFHYNS